jgi:heme/copper-type cytochrome/quinol oxidase subunit 2
MLETLYVIAAEAPGRGGNPDDGWGVLTILVTILVMALVIATVVFLFIRFGRRETGRHEEHEPGSVGRTG